jgi:hypothetical protein
LLPLGPSLKLLRNVHPQSSDGNAASGRFAVQFPRCRYEGKMLTPSVVARIKERFSLPGVGIYAAHVAGFGQVARAARKRQVLQLIAAPKRLRQKVVD